jgi:hypothetical protein
MTAYGAPCPFPLVPAIDELCPKPDPCGVQVILIRMKLANLVRTGRDSLNHGLGLSPGQRNLRIQNTWRYAVSQGGVGSSRSRRNAGLNSFD